MPKSLTSSAIALAAVVAVVVMGGCTRPPASQPSPGATTAPTSAPVSPSVSPSPPPSPATSASPSMSAGQRAAVAKVTEYNRVIERLSSDPRTSLDEISTVARGDAAFQWQDWISRDRLAGNRMTGTFVLTYVKADPGKDAREWLVTMCVDSTAVTMLDKNGKSISNKSNPQRVLTRFTVQQDPGINEWFVTQDEVTGQCKGS